MTNQPKIKLQFSEKQNEAFEIFKSPNPCSIVYGGGARGGKTFWGSLCIITECLEKPGSQWLIARESLKGLKRTTLRTFFSVLHLLQNQYKQTGWAFDYNFNAQEMVLTFFNGSTIFFSELRYLLSDPEFDRLGSYDLTGYWLDEAQEISIEAVQTLKFRLSLLQGEGWKAEPKEIYTCNPRRNWIYSDYWKPLIKEKKTAKHDEKLKDKYFITALYSDNPFIDREKYKQTVLKSNNKIKIERLLYGNFEYDDDPSKLVDYDSLLDMFTRYDSNTFKSDEKATRYISADIARLGNDKTVIYVWEGLTVLKTVVRAKEKTNVIADLIKSLALENNVSNSNIIIDEDGVGGGVVDHIPNAKGFVNNSACIQPLIAKYKPERKLNYVNLKSQCSFKLAELINQNKISIIDINEKAKEQLIEEIDIIKQTHVDSDKKLSVLSKDEEKEILGRSPDYKDALMMRMYFEVKPERKLAFMRV